MTWSPDRAEVVLRAGCSHQLPPDHWFGPRVGEDHSAGALGLGLTLGTSEGLEAEVGGPTGTHRLSKGIVPQHGGGSIMILAAMNDDNHRKGQGLWESRE